MTGRAEGLTLLQRLLGAPDTTFRPGQWEAITAVVERAERLLVVQATGCWWTTWWTPVGPSWSRLRFFGRLAAKWSTPLPLRPVGVEEPDEIERRATPRG